MASYEADLLFSEEVGVVCHLIARPEGRGGRLLRCGIFVASVGYVAVGLYAALLGPYSASGMSAVLRWY
jgi:hypothetical protein